MSVLVESSLGEAYRLPDSVRDLAGAQKLVDAAEASEYGAGWLTLYGPEWSPSRGPVLVRASSIVAVRIEQVTP